MSYRTYTISHSKSEGFMLNLEEHSWFRDQVYEIVDRVNHFIFDRHSLGVTGFTICNALGNWAYRAEKRIQSIPLSPDLAVALSAPGAWDWMWENEEND